jgi:uncharacterized RDD family membrane protein YckC
MQTGDAVMSDRASELEGGDGLRPHAYFPAQQPELFDGVLGKRFVAFIIDAALILAMTFIGWFVLVVLGVLTFGLAWLLIGLVFPVVALGYCGLTLGGPTSATVGMRMSGLEMRTWYGAPMYFVLAVVHAVLFWVSISILTPFILLVGFFNDRRRLLHDFLIGTVVINKL